MAEFGEVMRQWRRMCDTMDLCEKCNLGDNSLDCKVCGSVPVYVCEKDIATIETRIMAWAAEHPEPVYETWFEYLLRIGVIPDNAPAGGEYQWIVESIKHNHIPAVIAEKLGIQPKEDI